MTFSAQKNQNNTTYKKEKKKKNHQQQNNKFTKKICLRQFQAVMLL